MLLLVTIPNFATLIDVGFRVAVVVVAGDDTELCNAVVEFRVICRCCCWGRYFFLFVAVVAVVVVGTRYTRN